MKLPGEITELVAFLEGQGLALLRKEGPLRSSFGNIYMEYGDERLKVEIVLDRSVWQIAVADATRPGHPYALDLLQDCFIGPPYDLLLPLPEYVRLLQRIWQDLLDAFSPSRREATHARLHRLGRARMIRILPSWCDAALKLETFLIAHGMAFQVRFAPEGSFGERLMQYADDVIGVRITCGRMDSGRHWDVAVADVARFDTWYGISLIRCLIERTGDRTMSLDRTFEFLPENWEPIRDLFSASRRDATHARLKELSEQESTPS